MFFQNLAIPHLEVKIKFLCLNLVCDLTGNQQNAVEVTFL